MLIFSTLIENPVKAHYSIPLKYKIVEYLFLTVHAHILYAGLGSMSTHSNLESQRRELLTNGSILSDSARTLYSILLDKRNINSLFGQDYKCKI